jgi:hypothetical protein
MILLNSDDAKYFAALKMGRVCPNALFMNNKFDIKSAQHGSGWLVTIKHYHPDKKPATEYVFSCTIEDSPKNAECECKESSG